MTVTLWRQAQASGCSSDLQGKSVKLESKGLLFAREHNLLPCQAGTEESIPKVDAIKKIFLWTYERNTWQWDALCALILVFIFLTPKSWFKASERRGITTHQSPVPAVVFVGPEVVENQRDTSRLREQVRALSGRASAEVGAIEKIVDKEGRTVGYKVDIR